MNYGNSIKVEYNFEEAATKVTVSAINANAMLAQWKEMIRKVLQQK